jgi:hypothetical protein
MPANGAPEPIAEASLLLVLFRQVLFRLAFFEFPVLQFGSGSGLRNRNFKLGFNSEIKLGRNHEATPERQNLGAP